MPYSHFSQFFFWNKLRKSTFSVCYVLNVQSTMMYYYVWLSSFWSHFYKKVRKYVLGSWQKAWQRVHCPEKMRPKLWKITHCGWKVFSTFFFVLYTPQPLFSFLYWYMKKIMMGIHIPHGVEFSTHVVSRFWIFPT